jgi:hypothetical protein
MPRVTAISLPQALSPLSSLPAVRRVDRKSLHQPHAALGIEIEIAIGIETRLRRPVFPRFKTATRHTWDVLHPSGATGFRAAKSIRKAQNP